MTDSVMKPCFPETAPVIEIFHGVHATLLSDFSRFSNGKLPFFATCCEVSSKGKKIGEIGADGGGTWIIKIEQAWYSVNMSEAFEFCQNAHIASL